MLQFICSSSLIVSLCICFVKTKQWVFIISKTEHLEENKLNTFEPFWNLWRWLWKFPRTYCEWNQLKMSKKATLFMLTRLCLKLAACGVSRCVWNQYLKQILWIHAGRRLAGWQRLTERERVEFRISRQIDLKEAKKRRSELGIFELQFQRLVATKSRRGFLVVKKSAFVHAYKHTRNKRSAVHKMQFIFWSRHQLTV